MKNLKLSYLIATVILLSCNKVNYSKLQGVYTDENQINLELNKNGKYNLEIAKKPFVFNKTPTKVNGSYKKNGNKLILEIENTDYKSYEIEIPPQSIIDGLRWSKKSGHKILLTLCSYERQKII